MNPNKKYIATLVNGERRDYSLDTIDEMSFYPDQHIVIYDDTFTDERINKLLFTDNEPNPAKSL